MLLGKDDFKLSKSCVFHISLGFFLVSIHVGLFVGFQSLTGAMSKEVVQTVKVVLFLRLVDLSLDLPLDLLVSVLLQLHG